ncbi:MAG: hypothetical protein NUV87_04510 [Candidatus Roizmanbacteria bacterium]|nr:hypothetical protein [Candidatus Roizmanbacteria bacterium]
MNKFLYYLIVALRVLVAPLVFIWPLLSVILSFFLDVIDIEFASRRVLTLSKYERYDKALDTWWYINVMIFAWFQMPNYRYILLILFVFRTIGEMIFFIKNDRRIFFLFPNFFENIFFLIFFSIYFKPLHFLLSEKYIYFSLSVVIIAKIFQEWWVHIALISIPEYFFGKKRKWRKRK